MAAESYGRRRGGKAVNTSGSSRAVLDLLMGAAYYVRSSKMANERRPCGLPTNRPRRQNKASIRKLKTCGSRDLYPVKSPGYIEVTAVVFSP